MTTQNNAAQPVLTDEEIQDIAELYDIYGEKPEFARAVEFALLHKLRAPVALRLPPRESENCGSSSAIAYAMAYNKALDDVAAINASAPVADERAALQRIVETAKDGANSGDRHARCVEIARATLASAPVAGEAVAWAVFAPNGNIRYWHHDKANVEAFAAKHGLPVTGIADAAPQASSVAGEAAGEIVLFGSDLKEVSWRDGKMPPAGTKLCVAPQAPAGWRWTLHPAGLHPDVYAAAAARDSAEDVRNAALEEAAAHIESKKPVGTIALVVQAFADEVRTLKSTPAPTAAEGSEDDMLTIAYLAGARAEKERAGDALLAELLDDPLLRDLLGYIEDTGPADVWGAAQAWMAKRNAALAARKEGDGNAN